MDIVTILNWEKFNPRNDIKFHSWFRLQNTIFEDPDFFSLSHAEKLFWLYLLCSASKKRSAEIKIIKDHVKRIAGFSESEVNSSIKKLSYYGFIEYKNVEPNADVTETLRTRDATYKQTNKQTNKGAKSSVNFLAVFDFEKIWKSYPRKVNKSEGRERFNRLIKSINDFDQLIIAVENYASHCKKLNLEEKHVRHFSTFLGKEKAENWRDWIEGVQSNSGGAPAWCKFEDPNVDWSND